MHMRFSRVGDKVLGARIGKPCDYSEFGAKTKMKNKNGNQRLYDRTIKKRLLTIALSTAIAGGAGLSTVQAIIQGVSSVSVQPPTTNVGKDSTPALPMTKSTERARSRIVTRSAFLPVVTALRQCCH